MAAAKKIEKAPERATPAFRRPAALAAPPFVPPLQKSVLDLPAFAKKAAIGPQDPVAERQWKKLCAAERKRTSTKAWAKKVGAPPTTLLATAKTAKTSKPATKPQVSERGHARHVMADQAKVICGNILEALSKGPASFEWLCKRFPALTESQLRYQISSLRDQKLVNKTGAREMTLYELRGASKAKKTAPKAKKAAPKAKKKAVKAKKKAVSK